MTWISQWNIPHCLMINNVPSSTSTTGNSMAMQPLATVHPDYVKEMLSLKTEIS